MTTVISQELIDSNHEDSFWYDGYIGEVVEGNRSIRIYAEGDTFIALQDKNVYSPEDFTPDEYAQGDKLLWEVEDTDMGRWINNNWFSFEFQWKGEWIDVDDLDVAYSHTDAIKAAEDMIRDDDFWKEFEDESFGY